MTCCGIPAETVSWDRVRETRTCFEQRFAPSYIYIHHSIIVIIRRFKLLRYLTACQNLTCWIGVLLLWLSFIIIHIYCNYLLNPRSWTMGRRYYCDYCDRSFQDNMHNRKKHLFGVQHHRSKKAWFDHFRGRKNHNFHILFIFRILLA